MNMTFHWVLPLTAQLLHPVGPSRKGPLDFLDASRVPPRWMRDSAAGLLVPSPAAGGGPGAEWHGTARPGPAQPAPLPAPPTASWSRTGPAALAASSSVSGTGDRGTGRGGREIRGV